MKPLVVAILLALLPRDNEFTTDMVEVNHYCDDTIGRENFVQVIWWDFDYQRCEWAVRDWRLIRDGRPTPEKTANGWVCRWKDGEQWRSVTSSQCRETWTFYDPEVSDRQRLPPEKRRRFQ